MTETPVAYARRARLSLRLLAREDVERVYAAALERLAAPGIVPAGDAARTALLAAGATPVAGPTGLAADAGGSPEALTLSPALVEAAAARAPKRVVLGGRDEGGDVVLEPGAALLAAGGLPAPAVGSPGGEAPRQATGDDLVAACRLADALTDVAVVCGPPLFPDPRQVVGAATVALAVRSSSKHLQVTGLKSPSEAVAAAELAVALRDGASDVRRRPPLSLIGGARVFGAAAAFARVGLPAGALVAAPAPAQARQGAELTPARVTEALVAFVADVLAANAAVQAVAPGAAYIAPVWPALAGLPAVGAVATAFIVAATQVLTHAGIPVSAHVFATSAAAPDWLACTDGSFAALGAVAAGAALVTGAGTLGGGSVFSPQQLVADAEIHSWCTAVAAGIPVDDETIALDVIKDVGIGGNFLGQKHTRRHLKEVWRPRLLDRTMWDAWVAGGRQGAADKAAGLAGALLAQHQAPLLDAERAATIERIVATSGL